MQVISDDSRLDPKQALVQLDGDLKVLQRLQILHVADVLAEEGILLPGETEGVLQFGSAGQDMLCHEGQTDGERRITSRPPHGLQKLQVCRSASLQVLT